MVMCCDACFIELTHYTYKIHLRDYLCPLTVVLDAYFGSVLSFSQIHIVK